MIVALVISNFEVHLTWTWYFLRGVYVTLRLGGEKITNGTMLGLVM